MCNLCLPDIAICKSYILHPWLARTLPTLQYLHVYHFNELFDLSGHLLFDCQLCDNPIFVGALIFSFARWQYFLLACVNHNTQYPYIFHRHTFFFFYITNLCNPHREYNMQRQNQMSLPRQMVHLYREKKERGMRRKVRHSFMCTVSVRK